MSRFKAGAEVRRELERAAQSCETCVNHLAKAASFCVAANRPESSDTLAALGEMVLRIKTMIVEFNVSLGYGAKPQLKSEE